VINTLETIFPREANNDYQGSPIAFYGFLPIVAMQEFSACVHYFGDRTYKPVDRVGSVPRRFRPVGTGGPSPVCLSLR
jgi:hypothetical protein